MQITLANGGQESRIEVPPGTEVGHVRTLIEDLQDIGAPSSYTLAINGAGVEDSAPLQPGSVVTFRPLAGNKG